MVKNCQDALRYIVSYVRLCWRNHCWASTEQSTFITKTVYRNMLGCWNPLRFGFASLSNNLINPKYFHRQSVSNLINNIRQHIPCWEEFLQRSVQQSECLQALIKICVGGNFGERSFCWTRFYLDLIKCLTWRGGWLSLCRSGDRRLVWRRCDLVPPGSGSSSPAQTSS